MTPEAGYYRKSPFFLSTADSEDVKAEILVLQERLRKFDQGETDGGSPMDEEEAKRISDWLDDAYQTLADRGEKKTEFKTPFKMVELKRRGRTYTVLRDATGRFVRWMK